MNKVLLVEDDPGIASLIKEGLEDAGFRVDTVTSWTEGAVLVQDNIYHLFLLDVMLPGKDGFAICEDLRAHRNRAPILMLTARDAVSDRVRGLDSGADDYLPKPFDFQELLARVRALLRRDKMHRTRMIRVGDLEIDVARRSVTRAGREIHLSHREYDLLEALAAREGQVLTREIIQERVWMNEDAFSNTVSVYIGMLRKKIDAGSPVKLIHTVHGVGYTLRMPEEHSE